MKNFIYFEIRYVGGTIAKGSNSIEFFNSHYFLTKAEADAYYIREANHYSFRPDARHFEGIEEYKHEIEMSNEEKLELLNRIKERANFAFLKDAKYKYQWVIDHEINNLEMISEGDKYKYQWVIDHEINNLEMISEGELIDCYYSDGKQELTIEGIPAYELTYIVNKKQLDQWDFELLINETDDCRLQSDVESASREAINCDQTVLVEDKNNNLTIEITRAKKGGAL